jgi:type IV secretory pathway VirB9-like protein
MTALYAEEKEDLSRVRESDDDYRPQRGQSVLGEGREVRSKVRQGTLGDSRRSSHRAYVAGLLALAVSLPCFAGDLSPQSRVIHYSEDGEIPHVYIHAGYSLELVFDPQETVVRVAISNAYFENTAIANKVVFLAHGDEAGKGASAHCFMASGNEYLFLLKEVTKEATSADLRIRVKGESKEFQDAQVAPPKLFTETQMEEVKHQLTVQKETTQKEQERAARAISIAATKEVSVLHHDYELYGRKGEPLKVTVYRDDKFTYVECAGSETPALFEIKDNQPSLINAVFVDGKFTVPKILDLGVVTVGKSEVKFKRSGGNS